MPRDGSGVYSTPTGTYGTPNAKILSAPYNSNVDDVAADLNTPRPIVAGGTGATTAAGALTALGAASTSYVDTQDALKVAKTGDTMTGDLTVTTNLRVDGNIALGSATFATSGGIYTNIFDTAANGAIVIGSGSDPGNYYRNTSHTFQGIAGSGSTVVKIGNYLTVGFNNPVGFAGLIKVGYPGGGSDYGMSLRPVTDTTTAILFCNAAGTANGTISSGPSSVAYNTTSDERLKENLESFDAGRIVDATEVYSFTWKSTGERSYGVSAQQANEVYPEAVTYMEKDDWYGIDYSKYVPVLLQELKALRARVAMLEGGLSGKPA